MCSSHLVGQSLPVIVALAMASNVPAEDAIDFAKDVAPILATHCQKCHGAEKHEGGLRLHRAADAMKGGDSGEVLLPGKSAESLLWQYVSGEGALLMPPEETGDRLTVEEMATLKNWIDQGAVWPAESGDSAKARGEDHWAYKKPVLPEPPPVSAPEWCHNEIDRFVLARLDAEGLKPSPEADKARLLRRVSLDLTGLPPNLEEVDAFLADDASDAYEKAVDRLLASPAYGERWARPWLDLARYADTQGYEKDNRRTTWRYRDWVIEALNRDLPFDQFTIEQLAGDMLPNATLDQRIATGFHRQTMTNTEGGTDNEEFRFEAVVDRINTTMTVWQGTTIMCCQCHSHKYDPFTQREYWRLFAFLNNTADADTDDDAPYIEAPPLEMAAQLASMRSEIAVLENALAADTPAFNEAFAAWEAQQRAATAAWTTLDTNEVQSVAGVKWEPRDNGSLLAAGDAPDKDTVVVAVRPATKTIRALRLEALSDESLVGNGPGRGDNGNFVLSELRLSVIAQGSAEPREVTLASAAADFEQGDKPFTAAQAIDNDEANGWAVGGETGKGHEAIFTLAEPLALPDGATLQITLVQLYGGKHVLGRFRLSATDSADALSPLPGDVRSALAVPLAERTLEQQATLAAYFRATAPQLKAIRDRVAEVKQSLPKPPTTLVMQERTDSRKSFIHTRGAYLAPDEEVQPGVPAMLNSLPEGAALNRLTFARWLVSPENPLTARVTMNRIWEQYFGQGLVSTSEDFGTQGEPPTHPELFDWLATEFIRQSWSMKAMHRLIVTSATYRQDARANEELVERDPFNKLYARGPRVRLEAEMLRDQALAVSGLLSHKMYGPSVMPPQPEGVWLVVYSGDKWITSEGEDQYRRGLYTFWRRTSPYPAMVTFDAPSREFCVERRVRSNTPLQALTLLNDAVYVEAAQALARNMMAPADATPEQRVMHGFRACLARRPVEAEVDKLVALYESELEHFRNEPEAAVAMCGGVPDGMDSSQLAACTIVANVLLNLDEMVTK